jgi:peptidoglycan/xylan/chitin deacetylase (PgdA/CDA1 family)
VPQSEWILTFDDGPLPADVTEIGDQSVDEMLAPLDSILESLATQLAQPIPAVFFLRGPAYPWVPAAPDALLAEGVRRIDQAGQNLGLHCHRHDPDLWHGWPGTADAIWRDLDECLRYFSAMTTQPLLTFRPPYGDGGLSSVAWATENGRRFHRWDIDSEDWLHHPDAGLLRRFENDASGHLDHILASLPAKMWFHALWPGPNDLLLHVSRRTADALPQIIERIIEITSGLGRDARFVVPDAYLRL